MYANGKLQVVVADFKEPQRPLGRRRSRKKQRQRTARTQQRNLQFVTNWVFNSIVKFESFVFHYYVHCNRRSIQIQFQFYLDDPLIMHLI